jgi:DNA polymerase-3 subunit epsilon
LRSWFVKNGDKYFGSWFWSNSLDVMVLATQKLLSKRAKMENFKLKTVAAEFGITIDEQRLHDAQYDIDLTRYIYSKCY